MKVPKKRGRPKLSPEEKARRKAERDAAKLAAKKEGMGKSNREKTVNTNEKVRVKSTTQFLLTPSGKCPVELYGSDKEAMAIWVSHVKNYKPRNTIHTLQSLGYWLRDFYNVNSQEYKDAYQNLSEVIKTFEIKDYDPMLKKLYARVTKEIIAEKALNQEL
jgi:hypothetical protein